MRGFTVCLFAFSLSVCVCVCLFWFVGLLARLRCVCVCLFSDGFFVYLLFGWFVGWLLTCLSVCRLVVPSIVLCGWLIAESFVCSVV